MSLRDNVERTIIYLRDNVERTIISLRDNVERTIISLRDNVEGKMIFRYWVIRNEAELMHCKSTKKKKLREKVNEREEEEYIKE